MWIKICANTNLEDALAAVEYGADAVGFVFAPSKRQITAAQVGEITRLLPPHVERVGVFLPGAVEDTVAAVHEAGLNAVQIHGRVDLRYADRLRARLGPSVSLIHVVSCAVDAEDTADLEAQLGTLAGAGRNERVLVDAQVAASSGGLGVSFDWKRARTVFDGFLGLRIITAGGLRPENVGDAIATLRPNGVDVASGVESAPGRKNHARLKAFIENARRA